MTILPKSKRHFLFTLLPLQLLGAAEVAIECNGQISVSKCEDLNESCKLWASTGECTANPTYMHLNCRKSCSMCDCVDLDLERCPQWAARNKCLGDAEEYMYLHCPYSCNACGYQGDPAALTKLRDERRRLADVGGDARLLETPFGYNQIVSPGMEEDISKIIEETAIYIKDKVMVDDSYKNVRRTCLNRDGSCAYWKHQGLCETNRVYMRKLCAPVCQICEELDFLFWCPLDHSKPTALSQVGDLDLLFERIAFEDQFERFGPRIISMPNNSTHPTALQGPWLIEFEKFLTEEECDHMIQLGANLVFKPSSDEGAERPDGTPESVRTSYRKSSSTWCGGECLDDEVTKRLEDRVELVTGIPRENSEHLQLLKYQTDEFYKYHHDCTPYHVERQMGPRILTMFFYLNSLEAGGGTNFPDLNITIVPKKGKAVLWPNVLNEDPLRMDRRTAHQALPVERGEKYGANLWIHQRDWREVAARNCL
jgi:prolyl 4-hydroxylase